MLVATEAENVSMVDPFDSSLHKHDTTLPYGSQGQIKLISLRHLCSRESLVISVKPEQMDSLYVSNISPFLIKKYSPLVSPSTIESSLESLLVSELNTMILGSFQQSSETMFIFTSTNYSIFTIGKYKDDSGKFHPVGCAYYHFNPLVGTFIPFLVVDRRSRKQGYASSLLILLQTLFTKSMGTSRVLVWGEFTLDAKLISFYRKLGFFPTIPSNYSLGFLLSKATIQGIRDLDENRNFLLEVRESMSHRYDQSVHSINLIPRDFETKFNKKVLKPKKLQHTLQGSKCCICELELFDGDAFAFCTTKCSTNQKIRATFQTSQNSYEICGLFLCLTCQSNFGLEESLSRCPLHHDYTEEVEDFENIAYRNHVVREYNKLRNLDQKKDGLKGYFNGCFESTNASSPVGSTQDNSSFCVYCKTKQCMKNNHEYNEESQSNLFSKYYNTSDKSTATLPYLIHNENHLRDVKEIRSLEEDKITKTCQHPMFFDANIGSSSSVFQNKLFGVKNITAMGDCGFLSVYIPIMTSSEELKQEYSNCFFTYIDKTLSYLDKVFPGKSDKLKKKLKKVKQQKPSSSRRTSTRLTTERGKGPKEKQKETKMNPPKRILEVSDIRKAFFLALMKSFVDRYNKDGKTFDLEDEEVLLATTNHFKDFFGTNYISSEEEQDAESAIVMECKSLIDVFGAKGYRNRNKMFHELYDRFGSDNTSKYASDVVYMDWTLLKFLPEITDNRLGAATVIDTEGISYASCSIYGMISDLEFYSDTNKHLLEVCDRFIFIRYLHNSHYEIYYNRKSYEATFSTKIDTENPDFDPVRILLNYCDSRSYYILSGEAKRSPVDENILLDSPNDLFTEKDIKFLYQTKFEQKRIQGLINKKAISQLEQWRSYQSVFNLLFRAWYTTASKTLGEDTTLVERLTNMETNDKIAVILFPILFTNVTKFRYASIFLQKLDSGAFSILDMNSTSFTSLHMKHNEFFELIYDVTKTTAYSLDQLEVLVELGLIKLPDPADLDVYRRHIFYLTYQWTRSDGSLYNQLFDQLGLPANNTLDGHECSYILEVIENLIPKCMDHSKKRLLYLLSILFYFYMQDSRDQNSPNDTIHTRLYKHFYMFSADFSVGGRLDEYLEESISFLYVKDDFFASHLSKIKNVCKPSNQDNWAEDIMKKLWMPLKVFEKENHFNWLLYLVLVNDIQMSTNKSQFFEEVTKDDGRKQILPFSVQPYRELMYESVKRLFGQKNMTALANAIMKFVEGTKYGNQSNVSINRELVTRELKSLKTALQYYMGYMDTTHIVLAQEINNTIEQHHHSKQSCTLDNKTIWDIKIQDNEIKKRSKNFEVIDLDESNTQIGEEQGRDHVSDVKQTRMSKSDKNIIRERYKKEKLQRLFSHALILSFHKYFTKKVSHQSSRLIPFPKNEFVPIQEKVLPKLKSSKDFMWHKEANDVYTISSTDICINIAGLYKIDYMQMHDRLINDRLDDKIIDAMIFLMMKERYHPSVENSNQTFKPVALPCIFNTAIEDRQYVLASKILQNSLKQAFGSDIFLFDMLLIPINVTNDHWYLVVIDFKFERCFALDSNDGYTTYNEKKKLEPSPLEHAKIEKVTKMFAFLYLYANNDVRDYLNDYVDRFKYYRGNELVPMQQDEKSCGVFVVMNLYSILKYQRLTNILQANMIEDFRVFMFYTFSHFHKVNLDQTMADDIKSEHSIFRRSGDDLITRSEVQNVKQELKMTNTYEDRNLRNLAQLTKNTIKRREKTGDTIVISDTEDENNDDDDTDTESDVTESKSQDKKGSETKAKQSTTLRPGDIKRRELPRLKIKSAHERNMDAKRKKETQKMKKLANLKKREASHSMGKDGLRRELIDSNRKFKLEFKTRNFWLKENDELFTQCENELRRMTRMMVTRYIGHHKAEKRFYLSSSSRANIYNNNMSGNLEIYRLHQEFIDSVEKDTTNGEAYRQLFATTIPLHDGWYDMADVPGNFFRNDLEKFYRNERAAYAFDKKDFTHLIYKVSDQCIYGRIYSGRSFSQTLYYETKLSQDYIETERIQHIAKKARNKPGVDQSLRTQAASDQDQSICSKQDPEIRYIQGKKNRCFQYGLLSCLAYLKKKSQKKSNKKSLPNYLMNVEKVIKENTVSLGGKSLIKRTNDLMTRNHWQVQSYNMNSKKRKRDDTSMILDLMNYNEGDQIMLVNLIDNDGVTNHYVAICDEYIFDSNFERALPLNIANLSICCGSKIQKKIFQGFGTVLDYRASTKIKAS